MGNCGGGELVKTRRWPRTSVERFIGGRRFGFRKRAAVVCCSWKGVFGDRGNSFFAARRRNGLCDRASSDRSSSFSADCQAT